MAPANLMMMTMIAASVLMASSSSSSSSSMSMSMSMSSAKEAFKGEGGIIHVGGKVLCQDCTQGWNEWVHGAKPIKGCRVSITCMDDRRRVIYYGSDETDEAGDFEMILINNFNNINGKPLDPTKCSVRLVSSPDPVCNIATDFAGGRSGVRLRRPTVVYRDLIKHVLDPFYYTTPMCDEPDTTHSSSTSDDNQSKY